MAFPMKRWNKKMRITMMGVLMNDDDMLILARLGVCLSLCLCSDIEFLVGFLAEFFFVVAFVFFIAI
eukprot:6059175-Ditylum_brightwellii.AAC.1